MCLRKKPRERASAERCLLFPFIKRAKRVSTLIPRIKSYTKWRRVNPLEDKQSQSGSGNLGTEIGTWDLDTISKVNSIKPTYTEDNLFALKCKLCNKRIPLEDLETHSSKCESVETRRTTATTTATTRNTSGRSTGPSLDSPKQILPKSSTKGSPSTPKSASKKRMPKKHSPFSKSVDVLPSQVKSPAAQKRRRRRSSQYSKPRIAMHGNKKNDEKGSPSSTKELGATDAGGDLPLANGVIDIETTMNKKKKKHRSGKSTSSHESKSGGSAGSGIRRGRTNKRRQKGSKGRSTSRSKSRHKRRINGDSPKHNRTPNESNKGWQPDPELGYKMISAINNAQRNSNTAHNLVLQLEHLKDGIRAIENLHEGMFHMLLKQAQSM